MKSVPIRHITASPIKPSSTGRFSIRTVEQVVNGKDLVHELHKHDFYFILALQKGTGIHEIDFTRYKVDDYSIFILRPGQVHRLELAALSQGYLIEFDTSFYLPRNSVTHLRWKKAISQNYCSVSMDKYERLSDILANLLNEFTTKEEGYVEAIKAHLDLFFIEYIRQSSNLSVDKHKLAPYSQERFDDLLRLLETNIATKKNVSEYATMLNLSAFQLNSITKASVGKTVSELINEQIVLEVKRNLLATANQVKEIADQLGYEDVSYFIRFFRKHTGVSPAEFRKNFR